MSASRSAFGTHVIRAMQSKKNWADMSDSDSDEESTPVQQLKQAAGLPAQAVAPASPALDATSPPPRVQAPAPDADEQTSRQKQGPATLTRAASAQAASSSPSPHVPTQAPAPAPAPSSTVPVTRAQSAISFRRNVPLPSQKPPQPAPAAAVVLPTLTWGQLTASASFGSRGVAAPSPAAAAAVSFTGAQPANLDGSDDEEEEEDDSAAPVSASGPTSSSSVHFDPELDSSRDGLPLLFKGLSKAPPAASASADSLAMVVEEEESKSRQGTKRKMQEADREGQKEEEPEAAAAPIDMKALVASFKAPTAATAAAPAPAKIAWGGAGLKQPAIAAAPIASAVPREVQQPANGKKQRRTESSAAPLLQRPNSFLSAVTGVVAPAAAAAAAPAAAASASAPSPLLAPKPTPAVAITAHQRAMRQKQIDIGKKTEGYINYIRIVPIASRGPTHPRTPDVNKSCSKRSMDGQVRQWRRLLHEFDPATLAAKAAGTYVQPATTGTKMEEEEEEGEEEASVAGSEGEMVEKSSAAASEDSFVIVQ